MHAASTLRPIVSVSGPLLFSEGPLQELDAAQQFPRPSRVALSGKAFKVAVSNRQQGNYCLWALGPFCLRAGGSSMSS